MKVDIKVNSLQVTFRITPETDSEKQDLEAASRYIALSPPMQLCFAGFQYMNPTVTLVAEKIR